MNTNHSSPPAVLILIVSLVASLGLASPVASAATITVFDGTFDDNWSIAHQSIAGHANAVFHATTEITQLLPDANWPSAAMRFNVTKDGATSGQWTWGAAALYDGAIIDPAAVGGIIGVAYSIDKSRFDGANTFIFRLLIEQDGRYYAATDVTGNNHRNNVAVTPVRTFLTFSGADLTANVFHEFIGPGNVLDSNSTPDFSVNGSPIRMGIYGLFNSSTTGIVRTTNAFDNFTVHFNVAIPEPATPLAGLALLGGLTLLPRKRRG